MRAFEDYAAMTEDPVKSMRRHLEVIKNPASSKEDCVVALEEIAFHAEDIDEANGNRELSSFLHNPMG